MEGVDYWYNDKEIYRDLYILRPSGEFLKKISWGMAYRFRKNHRP